MTHVFNDPAVFTEESVAGLVSVHRDLVRQVPGGVVRQGLARDGAVSVVLGGGSGHYPMFAGLVGPGLADGAVVGNIFTSPSAQYAYSVARSADRGAGVVFCYGNYAGDVMNFGLAEERLRAEGIRAASLVVTDDVLSAPPGEEHRRRGLVGDFVVLRALAGAAAEGRPFDDVVAAGARANERTRTVGVAFGGCTFPGAEHPLFEVPAGQMAVGLGIHGEPGLDLIDAVPARELARILLDHLLRDAPAGAGERVAVVVNGLGATTMEELFLLWRDVEEQLGARGLVAVEPEVGELTTSLDMSGLSLTVCWLDDELESWWTAPAYGPGYRKGHVERVVGSRTPDEADATSGPAQSLPPASDVSRRLAAGAGGVLLAALHAVRDAEQELAAADSVAGDGDHGRGMVRGLEAACARAHEVVAAGAGLGTTVASAGDAWAEQAGGTSGVLWGAALRALGDRLGDDAVPAADDLVDAAAEFARTVRHLGRVELGDKTMLDAIVPAVEAFTESVAQGTSPVPALQHAASVAGTAAERTAALRPRVGRARPLAERSVGHPDPGAVSFALVLRVVADHLA